MAEEHPSLPSAPFGSWEIEGGALVANLNGLDSNRQEVTRLKEHRQRYGFGDVALTLLLEGDADLFANPGKSGAPVRHLS